MPAQVHHWYTWNTSQTNSSVESRKCEITYLMQFCIMTAFFVFIMVVMIYTATFFPMSPLVFDEEKPMQARTGMW
jgi:hypothetical protein